MVSPQQIATPPSSEPGDVPAGERSDSQGYSFASLIDVDTLTSSIPNLKKEHSPSAKYGKKNSHASTQVFSSPKVSPVISAHDASEWGAPQSASSSPSSDSRAISEWSDAKVQATAARFNALRVSGLSGDADKTTPYKPGRHSFFTNSAAAEPGDFVPVRSRNNSFSYAPIAEGVSTAPFASIVPFAVPSASRVDYGGAAWNGASSNSFSRHQQGERTGPTSVWAQPTRSNFSNTARSSQMNGDRSIENASVIPEELAYISKASQSNSNSTFGGGASSSNSSGSPSNGSVSSSESFNTFLNNRMSSMSNTGFRNTGRRSTLQPNNSSSGINGVIASLDRTNRRHSIEFEAGEPVIGQNSLKNTIADSSFQTLTYEPTNNFRHSLAVGQAQNALINCLPAGVLDENLGRQMPHSRRYSHADVSNINALARNENANQLERDHPLKDVGKGVPISSLPPMAKLWVVEFKAGRSDVYYSVGAANNVFNVGDLVIVEGDRGKDLGKIMSEITPQELVELQIRQHPALDFVHMTNREIHPRIVYRRAHVDEIKHLMIKCEDEERGLKFIRSRVVAHNLDMHVIDAEYQFDRRKLTFYFISNERVDFRNLIQELFKIYKTRIWLCSVNGRNRPTSDSVGTPFDKSEN